MDVKTAFLYEEIEEEVYVTQPKGFEDPHNPKHIYRVVKALYGLHQAPRACQDKYVKDMLKKFDMESVRTTTTPYEVTKDKYKYDPDDAVNVHLFRSIIGSLMYLTAYRPDIMFAVSACSRHQVTPLTSHLNAVKKIFKYLKGQPNLGLWYPRDSPFQLEAYNDSDYAGSHGDRKYTTGGCQFLGRRLISWQCKKQTVVATSSTEAEYVAAASCCGQRVSKAAGCKGTPAGGSGSCIIPTGSYSFMLMTWFLLDDHNKVAYLEKGKGWEAYEQILDFLNRKHIWYALTHRPTIVFDSLVKQFWAIANVHTLEAGPSDIISTIDGNAVVVTESLIRTQLQLDDVNGLYKFTLHDVLDKMRAIGDGADAVAAGAAAAHDASPPPIVPPTHSTLGHSSAAHVTPVREPTQLRDPTPIVMANPNPEDPNVPNEDVLEEDPYHLLDYDEEEDPEMDIEAEEPEDDLVEEPEPLAGHGDQFDAHPNPQPGNMNGWVDDDDDVEEEDDENEDVDIEEDDDAEIIFPYEVQGDQTPPLRDESSDSEFEAEEADDELEVKEAGVEPAIEEAGVKPEVKEAGDEPKAEGADVELEAEEPNGAPEATIRTGSQRPFVVRDFPMGFYEAGESSTACDPQFVGGLAPWALRRDLEALRRHKRIRETGSEMSRTEVALLGSEAKIGKIEREILHRDLSGVKETLGKVVERLKVLESEENATLRKKLAKKEVLLDLTRMERDRAEKRLSELIWWNKRFYLEIVRKGVVPKLPYDDEGSKRPRKTSKKSDGDEGPSDPHGPLIGAGPTVPELIGYTYATFIKCDPLPFNRTEGAVGQLIQDKADEATEGEKRKGKSDRGGRSDNRREHNRRQNQRRGNAGAMINPAPNNNETCQKCKNNRHAGDCWKEPTPDFPRPPSPPPRTEDVGPITFTRPPSLTRHTFVLEDIYEGGGDFVSLPQSNEALQTPAAMAAGGAEDSPALTVLSLKLDRKRRLVLSDSEGDDATPTEHNIDLQKLLGAVDELYQKKEPDTFALLLTVGAFAAGDYILVHKFMSTLKRMLKHGLEVPKLLDGGDLTMAEQLIGFTKATLLNAQSAI
nr:ribonuclease H-like domain, reverse transcriptase, RNA-dependent DNA polymerase [Tanacetum cinerariifolium]